MIVWLTQTIATSAIAVLLSLLFVRWFGQTRTQSPDEIGASLDHLAKVESDLRRGLIDDPAAEAARLEIRKRALANSGKAPLLAGRSEFVLACVAGIVTAGAAGLYATTRDAEVSAMPGPTAVREGRASVALDAPAVRRLADATQTTSSANWWQPQPQSGLPSVEEMIERLAARLEKNSGDGEGWRTLGWSYFNIGRFSEASDAYSKAIEVNPGNMELRTSRIEAMVRSSDGKVTTAAAEAIEDILKIDPENARARFFRGLAKAQGGDKAAALADWVDLPGKVKSDEPWLPELKSGIAELERDPGTGVPAPAAESKPTTSKDVSVTLRGEVRQFPPIERGPSAQDLQAAKAMSPTDRSAMIHKMVDGLARRLEQSPRDAEGWIKLIRSRTVLGETDQAKQAFSRAIEVFTDDAGERDRIVAAAREVGIEEQ